MSFLYDAVHEAVNESLEPIYTNNNRTVIKAEEFDGTCYMVFNNYVDEDNPGKFEETFFDKKEAIDYVNNSSDTVKGPNNTDWYKNEEGKWLPLTYADGYKSLPELPKEVSDYMDVWFGFDVMVGMNPDGKIIMDNAGEYTEFDSVEDFIKEIEYNIEQTSNKEPLTEEKLDEDKLVDIEDFLTPDNYIHESVLKESLNERRNNIELPDRPQKGRPGSPEYSSNNSRKAREKRYRKFANLDESFIITEENINDWALTRTCTFENCSKDKLRAELLRQPYTGLEKYNED